jgi:hypothetical protein
MYFFYPSPQEADYWVNIDLVFDLKVDSLLKRVSQFEPAASKYCPDWAPDTFKKTKEELKLMQDRKDGHPVEAFRYATSFQYR